MNQENIGKFIASLRKEKELTQEQLAEQLGVNSRSVSRWENGNCMPDLSLLEMLAQELGVSVSELLSGMRQSNSPFQKEYAYLENYRILMEINRRMILGETITDNEKQKAITALLNGIACGEDIRKYKKRMRVNEVRDTIYPNYYIPPYNNNKKLRLIQGYLPKTNILYANHYELEILRLLLLLAPEDEKVMEMVQNTVHRLKNTCFGNSCTQGECLATGISVLRFLTVVRPDDAEWIEQLLTPLGERFLNFGSEIPLSYLLMTFTDINNEKTKELMSQKRDWLVMLLNSSRMSGKGTDNYKLMEKRIIRKALEMLAEAEEDKDCSC